MNDSIKQLASQIKDSKNENELFSFISSIDDNNQLFKLTNIISRKVDALEFTNTCKFAVLGNFTLDFLAPHIKSANVMLRIGSICYIAPFGQYFQEVLNTDSDLYKLQPDFMILALNMRELSPDIYFRYAELSPEERLSHSEEIVDHIIQWVKISVEELTTYILICNFIPPVYSQLGLADIREVQSEIEFYQLINKSIRKALLDFNQAYILDTSSLAARIGWENIYDAKMYYMAKMPWSERFLHAISHEVSHFVIATKGLFKKCLVLDLDNTVWGGVLGEEGVKGIKIGNGDPISEAYMDFQYKIKALKQRGIVLAICSKNNRSDVEEVFSVRTEMPLTLNDFATTKINWELKHENIQEIATELNIGLDSIVFIDDNPAEISLVRHMLKSVKSILLPRAAEDIAGFLDNLPIFEKLFVLNDDRSKTIQYHQNRKREESKVASLNIENYLESLNTQLYIRAVEPIDVSRIHQMVTKTNQFNLTTKRYNLSDINLFLENERYDCWCYSMIDKFGNMGIIGYILIELVNRNAEIDLFIMSCRAMGRGIETVVINWLKNCYFESKEFKSITASYIKTDKNKPVENLYIDQGFELVNSNKNSINYRLTRNKFSIIQCNWITII